MTTPRRGLKGDFTVVRTFARCLAGWMTCACLGLMAGSIKEAAWVEVTSPHFVALSDAGEGEARRVLEAFEAMRSVFTALLPQLKVDLHKPVVVIVTRDQDAMKQWVPAQFEGKDPKRASGLYLKRWERDYAVIRLDVDTQMDQRFSVIFHEYTHAIVHNNFSLLPTWLDEGIAEFYGATELHAGHVYLGRIPFHNLATLRRGRMRLADLVRVTPSSPEYMEGSRTGVFYAQSWALVHYLFMDEKAKASGLLKTYLQALGGASDPVEVARKGFGDLDDLDAQLARYTAKPMFTFLDAKRDIVLSDRDFTARPVPLAEALVLRAEVLALTGRDEAAHKLFEEALALAPGLPAVKAAVGLEAYRRGDWAKAEAHLRAAQGEGVQDFRVPLHLAELALREGLAQAATPETIQGWLEAADRMQPGFPGIQLDLCRVLARNPAQVERAVEVGLAAVRSTPSDPFMRLNVGSIFLSMGREAEARELGEQAARLAVDPGERSAVASFQATVAQAQAYREAQARLATPLLVPDTPQPPPGPPGTSTTPGKKPSRPPLKFWLPDTLAPLAREVQMALVEDRLDEAIQKVKEALPKAKGPYERPSLTALLKALQGRKAGH